MNEKPDEASERHRKMDLLLASRTLSQKSRRERMAELRAQARERKEFAAKHSQPLLSVSSLIQIPLILLGSLVGCLTAVIVLGSYVGLEAIAAREIEAIFTFGTLTFIASAFAITFGGITVIASQRTRSLAMSHTGYVAGVTNILINQTFEDDRKWPFSGLFWISLLIGLLLLFVTMMQTV